MDYPITTEDLAAAGVKDIALDDKTLVKSEHGVNEVKNEGADGALAENVSKSTNDGDGESSTATEDEEDSDADVEVSSTQEAESLLVAAIGLKEEGNDHFKENELEKAAISYRRGVNCIKKLNKNNTGNGQVKGLLVTLQTNFSMVRYKQEKYKVSAELASRAINIDTKNVKALYRRALAYRQMGNYDEAKADLRAALIVDANNASCKKEMASIKKDLEQSKENQKKALAKAFSSKSESFLYTDKEAEERRKEEEARRKKLEEQELYKKRKAEWEDDCVKRMMNNQKVESFEEWEEKRKQEEEREKKEKEKKWKEAEREKREAEKKAKKAAREQQRRDESDSEKDELTEKELAMMRGYKKTADGRTTSYFSREISEEEKSRIGCIAPKRLDETKSLVNENNGPVLQSEHQQHFSGPSVWNQARTWEEKDTTEWCKKQLRMRLQETSVIGDMLDCEITSITDLTGDASIALAGGKKRYIFDFHVKMKYEIKDARKGDVVGSGTVRIPDICSVSHEELEVQFDNWKVHPRQDLINQAIKIRTNLVGEIRKNVQLWVQDFNNQF